MQLNLNKDYGSAVSFEWTNCLIYTLVPALLNLDFGPLLVKIILKYKKLGLMMKRTHKFKWEIFYCWDTLMAQEKQ